MLHNAYDSNHKLTSLSVVLLYFLIWSDLGETISACPVQNSTHKHFTENR